MLAVDRIFPLAWYLGRTIDPENHVSPFVHTPYLALIAACVAQQKSVSFVRFCYVLLCFFVLFCSVFRGLVFVLFVLFSLVFVLFCFVFVLFCFVLYCGGDGESWWVLSSWDVVVTISVGVVFPLFFGVVPCTCIAVGVSAYLMPKNRSHCEPSICGSDVKKEHIFNMFS